MRVLASPASLKGVLPAREAAAALVEGFSDAGVAADALPVADGGEGTGDVLGAKTVSTVVVHDAFGRSRRAPIGMLGSDVAIVEAAAAIPLDPKRLDPWTASSRGLGELVREATGARELVVCLGGTATLDGGSGLRKALAELPVPTTVLCDTLIPLHAAPRLYGPQKGATSDGDIRALEERLAGMAELAPYADLPGAGAAGGLGAAFASLGARLVPGARWVLERLEFRRRAREAAFVVTGEGTVDATSATGKAVGDVVRVCSDLGKRCVVFGGRVTAPLEGAELRELSGDPARARQDLVALARRL